MSAILPGRLACTLARRLLAGELHPWGTLLGRQARAHARACAGCAAFAAGLAAVERGLAGAGAAPRPLPPAALRIRVATAVARLDPAPAVAGSRLVPVVLGSGALAAAALFALVALSRLEAWREPPRTVRIELPAGFRFPVQPGLTIRRASGEEERR